MSDDMSIWHHPLIRCLKEVRRKYYLVKDFIPILEYDRSAQYLSLEDESLHTCIEVLNSCINLLDGLNNLQPIDLNNENHEVYYWVRVELFSHLLQFIIHMQHMRYDLINCSSQLLHIFFVEMLTKTYNCLNNLIQWLGQILNVYDLNKDKQCKIKFLINETVSICVSVIYPKEADKEIFASTVSVLSTFIPILGHHREYVRINSIGYLIEHIGKLNELLDPFSKCQSYKLLVKLILPLSLVKLEIAKAYFRSIFSVFYNFLTNPTLFFYDNHEQIVITDHVFINYMTLLSELVELTGNENVTLRQNFSMSIEYLILDMLRFLSLIINRKTDYEISILSFFHTIINNLHAEISQDIIKSILQTVFCLFNTQNVQNILEERKSNIHAVLIKFLEIVSLIISHTEEFISMRPKLRSMTIDLCIQTLYPAIRENYAIDIRKTYYKLVHNLLISECSYFCTNNISNSFNHQIKQTSVEYSFIKLMESIAWSFTQLDIEQFRINIRAWKEICLKSHLYRRAIFRQYMCQPFLSLLFTLLIIRYYELYQDDIISILFQILTTDNNKVDFVHFIRNYLDQSNIKTTLTEKQRCLLLQNYGFNKMDFASFTQNLNHFMDDYRIYAKRNPDPTNLSKSFVFFVFDSFCL